jgi:glutathione S-transferase
LQHQPWIDRLEKQLIGALGLMENSVDVAPAWLFGDDVGQADVTAAIAWRFVQHVVAARIAADDYPGLAAFSARAESLPQFQACPLS